MFNLGENYSVVRCWKNAARFFKCWWQILCQFYTEQVPMMNVSYKPQKISPKSKVSWTFSQLSFFLERNRICDVWGLVSVFDAVFAFPARTLCACSFTRRFVTLTYTLSLLLTSSNHYRLNKSWIRRWAGFVLYRDGVGTGSDSLLINGIKGKDDLGLLIISWGQ